MKVDQTERAKQAWSILSDCAGNKRTITYKELAELMKVHHRPSRFYLELIQNHCKENELPPLSILAVNQNGQPGKGFTERQSDDLEEDFQKIFSYDWSKEKNPFKGNLTRAKEIEAHGIISIINSEWKDYKKGKNVNKNHKVYDAVIELFPRLLSDWAHESGFLKIQTETLQFRGSTGEGVITLSPWISAFDERNTVSARFGIYPVFLFSKDMSELNLTICVGATQFKDAYGSGKKSLEKVSEATQMIRDQFRNNNYKPPRLIEENLDLGAEKSNALHYFYEQGVISKFPGWDITSYDENGNEIYIEVKATKSNRIHGFIMSYNEMEKAKLPEVAPKYKIYRVLKALSKSPDLVVIDSIYSLLKSNDLSARPLSYIIQKQ